MRYLVYNVLRSNVYIVNIITYLNVRKQTNNLGHLTVLLFMSIEYVY